MRNIKKRSLWWVGICLLFILTFFLRTWNLLDVPPGLTHDEASNAHDASAILTGQHAIYFPSGYGHEPLFNYSVALFTLLLGESIFTLRFTSVVWGLLLWTLTVSLSLRWWGRRASIYTAVVITLSFWAQMMARVGLRAPVLPVLFTASMLLYDKAITNDKRINAYYVFSGIFLGAGFYTYMASRGLPLVYIAFLLTQLLLYRNRFRRIWQGTCLVIAIALALGSPLFLYLNANPELEQRVTQLGGAITSFFDGNSQPLIKNIADSLLLFLWRADPRWLYNISGRAALEPFFAFLFCIGVIQSLLQWRDKTHSLLLWWLGGGTAPALLTSVEYNTLHAIAAMPAVFLLVTFGLHMCSQPSTVFNRVVASFTGTKIKTYFSQKWKYIAAVLICSLIIFTGVESMYAYFRIWAQHRDVRVAYHHHLVSLGRELTRNQDISPVIITTLYPGEVHDPYTMDITVKDEQLPLKWVDGRFAVFVPGSITKLYVEDQTKLPSALWDIVEPATKKGNDLTFRSDDIPQVIKSYIWNSTTTWETISTTFSDDFYNPAGTSVAGPINYGDIIDLNGYEITQSVINTSVSLDLLTAWVVENPYPHELKIFVHLLDADGHIITQQDFLGAPVWQWESGDRILHLHHMQIDGGNTSEPTIIALGLYRQDNYARLPVFNEDTESDYVTLKVNLQNP